MRSPVAWLSMVVGCAAIVFGGIGMGGAYRRTKTRRMAMTGVICGTIGAGAPFVLFIVLVFVGAMWFND